MHKLWETKVVTALGFILSILTFINLKFSLIKIPTMIFATIFYKNKTLVLLLVRSDISGRFASSNLCSCLLTMK